MIYTTLWSPDTCDCRIIYEFDNSLPNEEIILTATDQTIPCSIHAPLGDPEKIRVAVLTEHQKICTAQVKLDDLLKDTHIITDPSQLEVLKLMGQEGTIYKPGYKPTIVLDDNRELKISIPQVTPEQEATILSQVKETVSNKFTKSNGSTITA